MKIFVFFLFVSASLFANSLKRVAYVDPQMFSGLWYEIARTYNYYQKDCVASSVEYKLDEQKNYEVHNRCFENVIGGDLVEYEGSAKSAFENGNMAVMDMTYFSIFTQRYNVYYIDKNYKLAIVADDHFENLWIMSRTPRIDKQTLSTLVALVEEKVDGQKLIFTPQDEKGRYK